MQSATSPSLFCGCKGRAYFFPFQIFSSFFFENDVFWHFLDFFLVSYIQFRYLCITLFNKTSMKEFTFQTTMKTRDYECDVQGVINNANYQHYFEVNRHDFLQSIGTSFQKLHDEGIDVMVSKVIINYKVSLRGGEEFICGLNVKKNGVRYVFQQEIYRKSDEKLCISAETHCVCVVNGVLSRGEELMHLLLPFIKE